MRFDNILKTVAPAVALLAAGALAGCKNSISINGVEGVPLAELDTSGDPPNGVVLAGPDNVIISDGAKLVISVDGDSDTASHLRFSLDDGTLGISRDNVDFTSKGKATVRVTMPAPKSLTMAGSGRITSAKLADEAEVTIAGSGTIETPNADVSRLELTIAGSGNYKAAGKAKALEVSIAGSGSADMGALMADSAEINIAGSGDVTFASDGNVEANIMGSGDVTVRGSARCEVNSLGSGKLTCEREPVSAAAE